MKMKAEKDTFDIFYVCRKCGSRNIKFYTEEIGGSSSCYSCSDCYPEEEKMTRNVCNPQKMYELKENVDPNTIIELRNSLVKNQKGYTRFEGYLARLVEMGNMLVENKPAVIKNIKKLDYKDGVIVKRKAT